MTEDPLLVSGAMECRIQRRLEFDLEAAHLPFLLKADYPRELY